MRFSESNLTIPKIIEVVVSCVLLLFVMNISLAQSRPKLEIRTLSSRPDLVSGDDALV
jgi:hypothetical protein